MTGLSIDRRSFLQGAAAGTAAVAALGTLGTAPVLTAFADEVVYTPGTYEASATGIGVVTVTVTFDETSITAVEVDASNETASIGGAAASTLAEQVLAAQSADIDGVSGATLTSTAVKTAVASCITQAIAGVSADEAAEETTEEASSARWSWEEEPEAIDDADIVEVIDADIVVVGAGIAGVSAAQSAAEEGASVVVLEKSSSVSGRGIAIGAIDTTWHLENPDVNQYVDATRAEKVFYEFSHSNVNRLLFRYWANNSGEAFDHLADYLKETYDYEPSLDPTALEDRWDAEDYYLEMPTAVTFGEGWYDEDGNWKMAGIVSKLAQWAQDLGAEFLFDTPAQQLVTDESGAVTGVIALGSEGYIKVNAAKGVIIATGDIGGNDEMLEAWCPLALRVPTNVYTPVGGNEGDGIKMALQAGASMQHGPAAPMIHPMGVGGPLAQSGDSLGFLCVNRDGERFTCEVNNTPGMANALFNQPEGIGWTIFDGGYYDKVLQMVPSNTGVDGTAIVDEATQDTIDAAVEADDGTCYRADTIAELAELIGADAETFQATVERWNYLVEQGEDVDMSLPAQYLTALDTPPYYASKMPQAILVIIYGLNCDSRSRVCDSSDNPIEGLYAIGNAQGNFFALDYPLVCAGISHGRCLTFGYKLPKAMLADELISY